MCVLLTPIVSQVHAQPTLTSDTDISTAGYFYLSWSSKEQGDYQLQQSMTPDFASGKTIYSGPQQATVISGLTNGDYYYRVRVNQTAWSEPLSVEVKHHSLSKALAFFGLGAVIFILLIVILVNAHQQRETD